MNSLSLSLSLSLLVDLFFYSYEGDFIQKLLYQKKKKLAVSFNLIFRYIDDVLSINNENFHTYVNAIYPNKLEQTHNRIKHECFLL